LLASCLPSRKVNAIVEGRIISNRNKKTQGKTI
jgi:hypothetical protein